MNRVLIVLWCVIAIGLSIIGFHTFKLHQTITSLKIDNIAKYQKQIETWVEPHKVIPSPSDLTIDHKTPTFPEFKDFLK